MRFEFINGMHTENSGSEKPLHESDVKVCLDSTTSTNITLSSGHCFGCGSYGLRNNPDGTTKPPCLITVDVNGDRKPTPYNAACKDYLCSEKNIYKFSDVMGTKLTDIFSIIITDKQAIPYGVAAQRAMYQAQAKK